jgi:colanic acid/amylovoran biosynthesis glycosyltransferase
VLSRLGVDYKGRNPDPADYEPINVVSCSNLIGLKRVHLIIEALSLVTDINVKWIHFGDGHLLDEIKENAAKLAPNIEVDLKGRVSNKEVLEFYRTNPIDLFINVSETEGVPVSIMEALSFGIPCFATDVGGTAEILEEIGGKLVSKEFEIDELSKYIVEIRDRAQSKDLRNGAFSLWKKKCVAKENYENLHKTFSKLPIWNRT